MSLMYHVQSEIPTCRYQCSTLLLEVNACCIDNNQAFRRNQILYSRLCPEIGRTSVKPGFKRWILISEVVIHLQHKPCSKHANGLFYIFIRLLLAYFAILSKSQSHMQYALLILISYVTLTCSNKLSWTLSDKTLNKNNN